jgi:hypothetical protein
MKYINIVLITINLLFLKNAIGQYVSDFRVNDDSTQSLQVNAKVSSDKNGNFVVVWKDERDTSGYPYNRNVFFQKYNYRGIPLGNNSKLTDYIGWVQEYYSINKDKQGNFAICWAEGRGDSYFSYIKLNYYDTSGNKLFGPIQINDTSYISIGNVSVSIIKNYIYIAFCYLIRGLSNFNLYLQKVDFWGNKIGNNTLINDDGMLWREKKNPEIAMSENGSFVVVWEDSRGGYASDIYMQRYNSEGQKIGINQKVNQDNDPYASQGQPDVSCDSIGNFTIVWTDNYQTGYYYLIYAQNYDSYGNMLGNNYRVDQGLVWNRFRPRICKRPDGKWIVGWQDYWANGQNWSPYAQRYDSSRMTIGGNFPITQQLPQIEKRFDDLTVSGDRVISVWTDLRNGNEDIYCNIISFQKPDSIISFIPGGITNIPAEFSLGQNYPNPFNSSTIIDFTLPLKGKVKLFVYDILGKEVAVPVDEELNPGHYSVDFNANNLTSGIYFYRLQTTNYSETKRMIILK